MRKDIQDWDNLVRPQIGTQYLPSRVVLPAIAPKKGLGRYKDIVILDIGSNTSPYNTPIDIIKAYCFTLPIESRYNMDIGNNIELKEEEKEEVFGELGTNFRYNEKSSNHFTNQEWKLVEDNENDFTLLWSFDHSDFPGLWSERYEHTIKVNKLNRITTFEGMKQKRKELLQLKRDKNLPQALSNHSIISQVLIQKPPNGWEQIKLNNIKNIKKEVKTIHSYCILTNDGNVYKWNKKEQLQNIKKTYENQLKVRLQDLKQNKDIWLRNNFDDDLKQIKRIIEQNEDTINRLTLQIDKLNDKILQKEETVDFITDDILDIFSINDIFIGIKKDNSIKIWGLWENHTMLKYTVKDNIREEPVLICDEVKDVVRLPKQCRWKRNETYIDNFQLIFRTDKYLNKLYEPTDTIIINVYTPSFKYAEGE